MTKPRQKSADNWLPPRVYRGRKSFEWHPRGGGSIRLCAIEATESQVWSAYRVASGELEIQNCDWVANQYFESIEFKGLAVRTTKDYQAYWAKLKQSFGDQLANSVKPEHVRKYMDFRGKESVAMANKEKKLFSIILRYGQERGWVKTNPCTPVKNFKEVGRTKYITHAEYESFYEFADPTLRIFIEISYLCAARGQDVRKIKMTDLKNGGLFIQQGKTNKSQLKLWNEDLEAVINRCLARSERIKHPKSPYLIVNKDGLAYTEFGLKSMWRRAREKARKATITEEKPNGVLIDFTFHDIKAKSISDYEGDKQFFSGHKTKAMAEKYNRDVDHVVSLKLNLSDTDDKEKVMVLLNNTVTKQ